MKRRTELMKLPSYAPETFLDGLESRMQLKNDAALARELAVAPALLSRIRNRHLPISATLLLSIHESTQIAIVELRRMMGDSRRLFS